MEPVFEHGQLRLYLLVVLAEGPSSGYDIIRGLQDRFGGLYSPSAGTVYPRLSKLEDDGLVQRTTQGRRSTFTITAAGREELARREEDVARLEERLATAHRRLADDMRDTVSSGAAQLRHHLEEAARFARAAAEGAEGTGGQGQAGSTGERNSFGGFGAGAPSGFAGLDPLTAFGQAIFGRRSDGTARSEWGDLARWLSYTASRGAAPRPEPATSADPSTDTSEAQAAGEASARGASRSRDGAPDSTDSPRRATEASGDTTPGDDAQTLHHEAASSSGDGERESSSRHIPDAHQWTQIVTILRDAAGRIQDVLEDGPRRN